MPKRIGRSRAAGVLFASRGRLRLGPVLVTALALASLPVHSRAQEPAESRADVSAQERSRETFAGLASVLRSWTSETESGGVDMPSIVARVGTEPDLLRSWVRENVSFVPYAGSLRGPHGVLTDRYGNSLDTALILATLLQLAGHDVRLANAKLSEAEVTSLIRRPPRRHARPTREPTRRELVEFFTADPRLEANLVQEAVDRAFASKAELTSLIERRFASSYPLVTKAFSAKMEAALPALEARARTAAADHWWVQVRQGERFLDLDPWREELGLAEASDVVEVERLPDALRHQVLVRVVVEISRGALRTEHVVLEHALTPATAKSPVAVLRHVPIGAKAPSPGSGEDAKVAMAKASLTATRWLPLLDIASEQHYDHIFAADGVIAQADAAGLVGTAEAFQKLNEAMTSAWSGSQLKTSDVGDLTAEWIEFEIQVPQDGPRRIRRPVFDLIGPAARARREVVPLDASLRSRRALALAGVHEIAVLGATPDEREIALRTTRDLIRLSEYAAATSSATIADVPRDAVRTGLPLHMFASLRIRFPELVAVTALDRPNVVMLHDEVYADSSGAYLSVASLDVVENSAWPAALAVGRGVLDTVIEGALLEPKNARKNAAALMAEDREQGRTWSLLASARDFQSPSALATDDVRQIWADTVKSGAAVLAGPQRPGLDVPIDVAWWRFDPQSGSVLGHDARGRGATATEKAQIFYLELSETVLCGFKSLADVAFGKSKTDFEADFVCMVGGYSGLAMGAHVFAAAAGAVSIAIGLFQTTYEGATGGKLP
jgi:hypothetical protein